MTVEVIQEPITALQEYAGIPNTFGVELVLDVLEQGPGDFELTERRVDVPYVKDYDAINGANPSHWAKRFNVSKWGLFTARMEGRRVGGAVVALDTPGLTMSGDHASSAVLWDIRVSRQARRQGVGSALFRAAEVWAKTRGCKQIEVETQNINVPACRFYARQGCVLAAVHRFAYPELPDEVRLIWRKALFPNSPSD